MAYLIRKHVDGTVADRWDLAGGDLVVGRGDKAHARHPDPEMSREHFKISCSGDQYVLQDLQSRNGTFVNGQRVTDPMPIFPGNEIMLGQTVRLILERQK